MVGKILDTLSELQLDDDTIIFYTSDNGPNAPFVKAIDSAGGLRGTKRLLYEGGIRAAMAVRWPGHVPAGRKSTFIWDMRDVFPTLCELGNAKDPDNLDGISVVPTLMGKKQNSRDIHYWEIHSPFQQAVRCGDWKAIRFGTEEPLELYDLKNDPREKQNVAADNAAVVEKFETFLATARTESPYFPAVQKKKSKKKKQ
jgi:arylsulfatase A-like enzyme